MNKLTLSSVLLLGLSVSAVAQDATAPPAKPAGEATTEATQPEPSTTTEVPTATEATPVETKPTTEEPAKTEEALDKTPELFEGSLDPEMLKDPDVAARLATDYPLDGDEWKEYALGVLEMEMQEVIDDLGDGKPKPPAHVTQPRILSRLDVMIAELEKKCSGGAGSNNAGNKPAEKSVLRKGKMKDGEMRAVKKEGDRWANIPPKEREKILQSQNEGFPPGYEDVLADYFRKLSKSEKPALPVDKDSEPASNPPGDGTN